MAERETGRNPRLRLACARCQRRKIRCDAQFPTCSNCQKASAECTDGDSLRLRDAHRSRTVSRLKRRITWLESIIRERLPDVDIAAESSASAGEAEAIDGESHASPAAEERSSLSRQQAAALQPMAPPDQRAHEIGLVSVGFNADQRYIGPSSGYFLARVLLSCSPRTGHQQEPAGRAAESMAQSTIDELVDAAHGPLALPKKAYAAQVCNVYFQVIHPQYPVIHETTFRGALDRMYNDDGMQPTNPDPYSCFQVYMVLAISSNILSCRAKRQIPGESYCLSALQYLSRINVQNSLPGLQCMLLLTIFALHSPFMRLNVWYLNYQCVAAVLDLGLQRNITTSSAISLLDQEIRTRIFWTVFTLDRTIATMMGRPIGLRDEACELRLPQNLSDQELTGAGDLPSNTTASVAFSIHLFKLAKLNSEIKYVANSIVRKAPSYAYPPITENNIQLWQEGMVKRLNQWLESIPQSESSNAYIQVICKIRYHSIKMLLLRPSPAIPKPSTESLLACYDSAYHTIGLFDQLYRQDLLVYDWMSLHGIILSTISVFYCIKAVPGLARTIELDELMNILNISFSILGASGEHWSAAKRCRSILDDVAKATISWMKDLKASSVRANDRASESISQEGQARGVSLVQNVPYEDVSIYNPGFTINPDLGVTQNLPTSSDLPDGMLTEESTWPGSFQQQYGFSNNVNIDDIMQNLFDDFIPQATLFPVGPEFYNC